MNQIIETRNEGSPMAARYEAQILAQIRDGKRFWSYAEMGKDLDVFRSQVVEPLRQLKDAGVVPALSEIECNVGGRQRITGVQIIGAVKESRENSDEYEPEEWRR